MADNSAILSHLTTQFSFRHYAWFIGIIFAPFTEYMTLDLVVCTQNTPQNGYATAISNYHKKPKSPKMFLYSQGEWGRLMCLHRSKQYSVTHKHSPCSTTLSLHYFLNKPSILPLQIKRGDCALKSCNLIGWEPWPSFSNQSKIKRFRSGDLDWLFWRELKNDGECMKEWFLSN